MPISKTSAELASTIYCKSQMTLLNYYRPWKYMLSKLHSSSRTVLHTVLNFIKHVKHLPAVHSARRVWVFETVKLRMFSKQRRRVRRRMSHKLRHLLHNLMTWLDMVTITCAQHEMISKVCVLAQWYLPYLLLYRHTWKNDSEVSKLQLWLLSMCPTHTTYRAAIPAYTSHLHAHYEKMDIRQWKLQKTYMKHQEDSTK